MQVGKPEAAQSLGKQLMTTGFSIGIFNSVLAGVFPYPCILRCLLYRLCLPLKLTGGLHLIRFPAALLQSDV